MKKITPQELFNCGAHLGHQASKVHPKAKKYLYKFEKKVSIIDLFQTAEQINKAREFLFNLGKKGENLLVVATKNQIKNDIKELCQKYSIFYITNKWIGGFITNFEEILKNIKKLKQLKKEKEDGEWNNLPKHERLKLEKKLQRILAIYQGVENLEKLPDVLYIIDIKREKNVVTEGNKRKIPIVAIVDTNANPELVDYPIIANDDSISSVKYISEQLINAYVDGRVSFFKKNINN